MKNRQINHRHTNSANPSIKIPSQPQQIQAQKLKINSPTDTQNKKLILGVNSSQFQQKDVGFLAAGNQQVLNKINQNATPSATNNESKIIIMSPKSLTQLNNQTQANSQVLSGKNSNLFSFGLSSPPGNKVRLVKKQSEEQGYKSLIQLLNKKEVSQSPEHFQISSQQQPGQTAFKSIHKPIVHLQQQQTSPTNKIIVTLKQRSPNNNNLGSQSQHQIQPPQQSQNKSPIRNLSPTSNNSSQNHNKIVLRKTDIKFKNDEQSNNAYGQEQRSMRQDQGDQSPGPNGVSATTAIPDLLNQGKQLAFDFIRGMLNIGNVKNQQDNTQQNKRKIETIQSPTSFGQKLKKKLFKFGSPGPNHKTVKKTSINFVNDMKKHGIDKDINSVNAMKVYFENSPLQSDSNNSFLENSQNQQQSPPSTARQDDKNQNKNLQINTDLLQDDPKSAYCSPQNQQQTCLFPFQRRARSQSPPKDQNLGSNQSMDSGQVQVDQAPTPSPGGAAGTKIGVNYFKNFIDKNSPTAAAMSQQQNGGKHKKQKSGGGPIIPNVLNVENIVKNQHDHHLQFIMGGTNHNHFGHHQKIRFHKSNNNIYNEFENEEQLEKNILQGKEVDDWISQPQLSLDKKENQNKKQSPTASESNTIKFSNQIIDQTAQSNTKLSNPKNPLSRLIPNNKHTKIQKNGCQGDADDVCDDDIGGKEFDDIVEFSRQFNQKKKNNNNYNNYDLEGVVDEFKDNNDEDECDILDSSLLLDDIKKNDDDWMFKTFENKNKNKQAKNRKSNPSDNSESINNLESHFNINEFEESADNAADVQGTEIVTQISGILDKWMKKQHQ